MAPSHKDVAKFYFEKLEDNKFKCRKCGITRKQTGSGYENLFSHVENKHKNYHHDMNSDISKLSFHYSVKTTTIFGWLEWIIMNGNSFSFVDNEYNKKYSNLNSITRPTFMKYLNELTRGGQ